MTTEKLKNDYQLQRPNADAFLKEFHHQFAALVQTQNVTLVVPIEGRVKTWNSLREKLNRKGIDLKSCSELTDFVGVRVITLFRGDVERLCSLIAKTFKVLQKEDKLEELETSRFGYLSQHFVVRIPRAWKKLPSFGGLDFQVEIQVRTGAQHIWAAASQALQYKKEEDVPPNVARSIYRVAALLETVDLEFERVLAQRRQYAQSKKAVADDSTLDTDNLRLILASRLPQANLWDNEQYSDLLEDLAAMGISAVGELHGLIDKYLDMALMEDRRRVDEEKGKEKPVGTIKERIDKGVYFSHTGLTRVMLRALYGKKFDDYLSARINERQAGRSASS